MTAPDVGINSLELPSRSVRGIAFPTIFQEGKLGEAFAYRPHDSDIVLRTYPKTGTNWVMHIVLNLLDYDNFDGDIANAHKKCPFVENVGTEDLKPGSFFMTHIPFDVNTFNPDAKYIIVLRNPRDVAVSFYHFSVQIANLFDDFPKDVYWFPRYAELFVNGKVWYGDYMEYHRNILEGLRKYGKPENIIYLIYEKMKKDPRGELLRVAEFLGGRAAELVKDEGVIETILERTSVDFMRKSAKEEMKGASGDSDTAKKGPKTIHFVRKGVVGDHVNYFTPEISKMFDDYIALDPRNKEIMDLFNV